LKTDAFDSNICRSFLQADWQRVLDSSIQVFLRECEAKVLALASAVDKAVVSELAKTGLDRARLGTMAGTASRTCATALKASFQAMKEVATNTQRDLNRSLLPMVQARMKQGYSNTMSVPGGKHVNIAMYYFVTTSES
jgi:hypothetical protein